MSKRIGLLESRLGTKLLRRTTRSLSLTEAGIRFYEQCEQALKILEDAKSTISHLNSSPRGLLKINIPQAFGRYLIVPHLPRFLKEYPEISLELVMGTRFESYDYDILVRRIEMLDDRLESQLFLDDQYLVCATSKYCKKHGRPNRPSDLSNHNCIIHRFAQPRNVFWFRSQTEAESCRITGNFIANNYEAIVDCVLQDLGVAILPGYIAEEHLRAGRMIKLFPHYTLPSPPFRAYYMKGSMPPKVSAFLEFFSRQYQQRQSEKLSRRFVTGM